MELFSAVTGRDRSLLFLFYCNSNSVNLPAAINQIMNLEERIKSFAVLGKSLRNSLNGSQMTDAGNGRYRFLTGYID